MPARRPPRAIAEAEPVHDADAEHLLGSYVRYFFGLVRRHIWLILAVTLGVVGFVVWSFRNERPAYQASAVVRIADARQALTQGIGTEVGSAVPIASVDPLQTEIHILRSRRVIGEAVDATGYRLQPRRQPALSGVLTDVRVAPSAEMDSLRLIFHDTRVTALVNSRRLTAEYGEPIETEGVSFTVASRPSETSEAVFGLYSRDGAINRLLGRLTVTPRRSTDIVDVRFLGESPAEARRVVNTLVDVFQEIDAQMAQQSARRRREFLATQVARNDSLLAEAQLALSAYQNRNREQSNPSRLAEQGSELLSLEQQQRSLEAQRRAYRGLLSTVQEAEGASRLEGLRVLISSPGIGGNPVVSRHYDRLIEYRTARDTLLSTGRTANNPDVSRLGDLIASTEVELIRAIDSHLKSLDTQIQSLEEIQNQSSAAIRSATPLPRAEAMAVQLREEVNTIRAMADLVREEHQRAQIAEAVEGGQVEIVDYATGASLVPTNKKRKLMFGSVIGLFLAMGVAYLRESLDTAIHVEEELESTTLVPMLATLPQIKQPARSRKRGASLVRAADGSGDTETYYAAGMEAYRKLSAAVTYFAGEATLRKIVVTSASAGEGKSTTAANLAVACAQSGNRVLLIDCDVVRPALHRLFGLSRSPGFLQVLDRREPVQAGIRDTRFEGLKLLPAGSLRGEPSTFNRVRMADLLAQVSRDFDLIVLDSPPVLPTANAVILSTLADGVLLVTRSGKTDRAAIRLALDQLSLVGAPVVGTVLNDPDGELDRYGYGQTAYYPRAQAG